MISPEILKNAAGVGLVGAAFIGGFVAMAPSSEDDGSGGVDKWADPVHVSYVDISDGAGSDVPEGGRIVEPENLSTPSDRRRLGSEARVRKLEARNRAARRAFGQLAEVYEHPEKYRPPSASNDAVDSAVSFRAMTPEQIEAVRRRGRSIRQTTERRHRPIPRQLLTQ